MFPNPGDVDGGTGGVPQASSGLYWQHTDSPTLGIVPRRSVLLPTSIRASAPPVSFLRQTAQSIHNAVGELLR